VAWLALPRLIALTTELTDLRRATIGAAALGLAFGATMLMSGTAAAVPLIRARSSTLSDALATRIAGVPRGRAIVAAEVAVTLALIVVSTLTARSAVRLATLDLGYRPDHVLLLRAASGRSVSRVQQRVFAGELSEKLSTIHGVTAVGAVGLTPLELGPIGDDRRVHAAGSVTIDPEAAPVVGYLVATPGYFAAMRIPLVRGRVFTAQEDEHTQAVTVLALSTARRLWGDGDPIGRQLIVSANPRPLLVVGVVADGRTRRLSSAGLDMYVPAAQSDDVPAAWAIRIALPAAEITPSIRSAVDALDDSRAISIEAFDARVRAEERPWLAAATIMEGFAATALLLALAAVHGLVAFVVSTRTREFGVRMALGATSLRIGWEATSQISSPLVIGMAGGLILAAALAGSLRAVLFGVNPLGAWNYAGGAVFVAAAVAAACVPAARRAARTDPAVALRHT
jgi:putative ABC transport system permease protein